VNNEVSEAQNSISLYENLIEFNSSLSHHESAVLMEDKAEQLRLLNKKESLKVSDSVSDSL
jgi:hypothetical protein